MARKNCSNIGGQAVLEGVMMRGVKSSATAVRDMNGNIQIESERFTPNSEKSFWFRVPIIRGVLSFVLSMVSGIKTITRASEVYGDLGDEAPSKFEKWLAEKLKIDIMSVVTFIGITLGLIFALALFVFLPNLIADGVIKIFKLSAIHSIFKNLISGAIRIAIFVLYIFLISKMKEIKRLFMYHGAEHKVISCFEQGSDLTVENAQKMKTVHDRCGTTFMFLVMFISIIFFSFFKWNNYLIRVATRILFIPVVAGISYEILKFTAKFDNVLTKIIKFPGLLLQKLTTKEPLDDMVEVAIVAFKEVAMLDKDKDFETKKFVTYHVWAKAKAIILDNLAEDKKSDIDTIVVYALNLEYFTMINDIKRISSVELEKAVDIAKRYSSGEPIQYVSRNAPFFGRIFNVTNDVLIPRFDSEILASKAIETIKNLLPTNKDLSYLDMCTGSGCIGITVAKELDINADLSDISLSALSVAKQNIAKFNVKAKTIESDMFANIEKKYDIITINPPYIPTLDIESLDKVVKDYEPKSALDGGVDGLDFYKRIAKDVVNYLNNDGLVLLEIGINQAEEIKQIFKNFVLCDVVDDFNYPPIPRVVVFKKGEYNV